jgi:hypothetical protein
MEDEYLIWSEEHGAWWRPASAGYTTSMAKAGRYTLKVAQDITDNANGGGTFCEVPVRLTAEMRGKFRMPSGGR